MPVIHHWRLAWLTEIIRLQESRWGALDDDSETRRARAEGGDFASRLQRRAQLLATRENLDQAASQWSHAGRWVGLGLALLALLAGVGAALAALGDGQRPVNLAMALGALLGLHGLTLALWGISLVWPGSSRPPPLLGRCWLWLTQRLARGPDQTLPPAALVDWLSRLGLLRWLLGAGSHLAWLIALSSATVSLLLMLSARHYGFTWETTLLPDHFFIRLTQGLGWLPSLLGFALPSPDHVQHSINMVPHTSQATYTAWSSWLLGCVVVYGWLPRLLAALFCLLRLRRLARRTPIIDTDDPAYARLRARLMPTSERVLPDGLPGAPDTLPDPPTTPTTPGAGRYRLAALELPADAPWPPPSLPARWHVEPNITNRQQRQALLEALYQQPAPCLVVVCDGRQTPDRGTLAFLKEAAGIVGQLHLVVLADPVHPHAQSSPAPRQALWQAAGTTLGLPSDQLHTHLDDALSGLVHHANC